MTLHIGRSWRGHRIEDDCSCPQEPCGLVDSAKVEKSCLEHHHTIAKTIRQTHPAERCPGGGQ